MSWRGDAQRASDLFCHSRICLRVSRQRRAKSTQVDQVLCSDRRLMAMCLVVSLSLVRDGKGDKVVEKTI
jgi:hypothetical protein